MAKKTGKIEEKEVVEKSVSDSSSIKSIAKEKVAGNNKAVNSETKTTETKPAAEKELPKAAEEIINTDNSESNKSDEKLKTTEQPEMKKSKSETKPVSGNVTVNGTQDAPAVRYSDEDLQMFAHVINEAKAEALDELRMLKERLEDLTSFDSGEESMIYSMHMAEQGSEAQEKEKTYAQIQRISEHIKKLEDAMERIRNKTYGICRVCGCLIAKERLMAVPVTTLSAAYKIHSKCPEDGFDVIEPVKI